MNLVELSDEEMEFLYRCCKTWYYDYLQGMKNTFSKNVMFLDKEKSLLKKLTGSAKIKKEF